MAVQAFNIPFNSVNAVRPWVAFVTTAVRHRPTGIARMKGKPQSLSDVNKEIRSNTSTDYPVIEVMDLTKRKGDSILFDQVNPTYGLPTMGNAYISGKGEAPTFSQGSARLDMTRYSINAGAYMDRQRSPHDVESLVSNMIATYLGNLQDERLLVHAAGARGFHQSDEWILPLEANDPAAFASIMINPVLAPANLRHYVANSLTGLDKFTPVAGVANIATLDIMTPQVLDALGQEFDLMPFAPKPIKLEGDTQAEDSPIRGVIFMSPSQFKSFKDGTFPGGISFRMLQAQSMARASAAKQNPVLMGEAALWNGFLILSMRKPIRFYANNAINYCASQTSAIESIATVNAIFGITHAIDRAIVLGANAIAHLIGKPVVYGTKETGDLEGLACMLATEITDMGNRIEVAGITADGVAKIRHTRRTRAGTDVFVENIVCIDTAVVLVGGV